jgi:hypothetical protein
LGNGLLPTDENEYIEIPKKCIVKTNLIDEIFGKQIESGNFEEMCKRVILTPTNEKVLDINNKILECLKKKGYEAKTFYSVDKVDEDEPQNYVDYPPEFLHAQNESSLPPYELALIKGCPLMLLVTLIHPLD